MTRSTVQKAVVVVTDTPKSLGQLREKLSVVTSAWFAQRYVSRSILRTVQVEKVAVEYVESMADVKRLETGTFRTVIS